MAPRLKVCAGTSTSTMVPITSFVNTPTPYSISSDVFEGLIVANIKGFPEDNGDVRRSEYFERDDRQGVTWSIQVQGRFLVPYSANNILFGNIFERPLKLPWGTSAVLKFMNFIDPTLEHDLTSHTKPWALSPLISTMPYFSHKRLLSTSGDSISIPPFPAAESVGESMDDLHLAVVDDHSNSSSPFSSSLCSYTEPTPTSSMSSLASSISLISTPSSKRKQAAKIRSPVIQGLEGDIKRLEGVSDRRTFFAAEQNRKSVVFGPDDLITIDFCYGFINFAPTLSLQLPGGLTFDLMRYWDGQPVQFVCCERKRPDDSDGNPWGRIFWCIAIEVEGD